MAQRYAELSLAAPIVFATRTARMLAAGHNPTSTDQREMLRMGIEKVDAFGAAWLAMTTRIAEAQVEWWLGSMRSLWSGAAWFESPLARQRTDVRRAQRAWLDVLDRGLAPIHRTATANARRLRRL
ncbi:MAG TPA: polyhydroxyalkanoate granule-associated phasin [Casimicrobiaceae bacterium]|nr:polyhydroxyalkanoate granule-associated phasin [Casimicrobiaceae bacterium]